MEVKVIVKDGKTKLTLVPKKTGGVGVAVIFKGVQMMKCVICKHGETRPGKATVTLERNGATLVIKDVPAEVCANCARGICKCEDTTARLLKSAEEAVKAGVKVDVRDYVAA